VRILSTFVLVSTIACAASETTPTVTPQDSSVDGTAADTSSSDTLEPADTSSTETTTTDAACSLVKPYSSKDKVCNDCAAARCCAEVNGCLGDKRCDDDYVNCILACALLPDDAGDAGGCISDCGTMYPAGKALYDTAIGCVEDKCPTECK
jgi:hypothetical protein